ncbi:MAG: S8 family serine peptidase, partial [Cytophagales bacterium]|nr:S8 family serine peptidase [Cytophagales bacterium]
LCGDHGETGSSLASPIVAGVAGLVWSRFPQLTPQQVMERVRVSSDYKDSIPENASLKEKMGYGMVNAYRAVTDTTLKAVRWDGDSIQNTFLGDPGYAFAGDTLRLSANFINYLAPTVGLTAIISSDSPYLIVVDSVTNLGAMGTLSSKWSSRDPFRIYIKPGSPNYFSAQIRVGFSDGTYRDYQYINLDNLNPVKVYPTYYDMDINQITLSIMNNGRFAFNDADANQSPSLGSGYKYQSIYHRTWEMGLLLGTSSSKVSDCIRGAQNTSNQQLKDTDLNSIIPITKSTSASDKTITVLFSDSLAPNPIGVQVLQKTYALKNSPDDKYIIVEYTITNNSGTTIDSLCGGIFSDWSVYNGIRFRSQWDPSIMTGVVAATSGIPYLNGLQVLYPTSKPAQAIFNYSSPANGISISDGFTESEKFSFMSRGILNQSAGLTNSGIYMASYVGTTLYNLLPGSKRTMAFAIVNGLNYTDITNTSKSAKNKFISLKQGPKPIIDSQFVVCKGGQVVFRPMGGTKYNIYDTIPGIRTALATNISTYTVSGVSTRKVYYITNNDSIFESKSSKITIDYSRVKASFSYSMSTNTKLRAIFSSTTPGTSWKWNLYGTTASGIQASKTFPTTGQYPIILTTVDSLGCVDSTTRNASIFLLPESPKP